MNNRIIRASFGAVITLLCIAAPLAFASPAQAATTTATVTSSVAVDKNLRNYTFMRDIYKTLYNVTTYTHSAAGIGVDSVQGVKTVHSGNIYKGSITVTGTPAVFTIIAKNTTDHIIKRLRSDHGHLTYLTA